MRAARYRPSCCSCSIAAAGAPAAYGELRRSHAPTIAVDAAGVHPTTAAAPPPARQSATSWPTYGYDSARQRAVAAPGLRPPFRRLWTFHGHALLEFPPVVGYGGVFEEAFDGRLYALDPRERPRALAYRLAPLRLGVARARRPPPLRHVHRQLGVPCATPTAASSSRSRADGPRALAARDRPDRVVAARRRTAPSTSAD